MVESVFLGVGGALFIAGTIILVTDKGPSQKSDVAPTAAGWRVTPAFGPKSGGLSFAATF